MSPSDGEHRLLQKAILTAKAGQRLQARALFLRILEEQPENPAAWYWLARVSDDVDEQIVALERVLALKPHLSQVRARLKRLRTRQQAIQREKAAWARKQTSKAEKLRKRGEGEEATALLLDVVEKYEKHEKAWLLLSELVDEEEDRVIALQNVLALNPKNKAARARLDALLHFRENPLDLAALYEEEGRFDEALAIYHQAARHAESRQEWDTIYKGINRLERRRESGVRHVRPNVSIIRLTPGPFLLYFLLLMVHNGLDPLQFTPSLWLEGLSVLVGGFLLAVASVRSHHPIWTRVFGEPGGSGSRLARFALSMTGWTLIGIAFVLLFGASLERLGDYSSLSGLP